MRFFKTLIAYRDRKLRERCVKYAISQPPTVTMNVDELAVRLYNYIKYGSYDIRI